jgi:hypothetical protein
MKRCSIGRDEMTGLPPVALAFSRLLPSGDRDSIVGDLLEDAAYRHLSGTRLTLWLCEECGRIGARMTVDRVRAWSVPPVRELAAGLIVDGARTFRHVRNGPLAALLSLVLVSASAAVLALSVDLLVGTLLSASGFHRDAAGHVGGRPPTAGWPLP